MTKLGLDKILSKTKSGSALGKCQRTMIKTSDLKSIVTELHKCWCHIEKYKDAAIEIRKHNNVVTNLTYGITLKNKVKK